MKTIHIVLPVLNEERRLGNGLDRLIPFMEEHFKNRCLVTVVDNGSTDQTENIARSYAKKCPFLHYLRISERGVGIAFRSGCEINRADIVGYMDIDLATDINALLLTDKLFDDPSIDIVNASRYEKESEIIGRKWYRSITSYGLMFLLKFLFKVKFNDSISGYKFFRKNAVDALLSHSGDEPGWFLCIELLIRAEREGFLIKDIPVKWVDNHDSKVNPVKLTLNYIKNIKELKAAFKREKKKGKRN
jgi:glycosyltransferase involved in cell wall biosynthesis